MSASAPPFRLSAIMSQYQIVPSLCMRRRSNAGGIENSWDKQSSRCIHVCIPLTSCIANAEICADTLNWTLGLMILKLSPPSLCSRLTSILFRHIQSGVVAFTVYWTVTCSYSAQLNSSFDVVWCNYAFMYKITFMIGTFKFQRSCPLNRFSSCYSVMMWTEWNVCFSCRSPALAALTSRVGMRSTVRSIMQTTFAD